MKNVTGSLNTVTATSADVRRLRNIALNIMEAITTAHDNYDHILQLLQKHNIDCGTVAGETRSNHLDRMVLCLAQLEAELNRAEILSTARTDLRDVRNSTNITEPSDQRARTKAGKLFLRISQALG